MNEQMLNIRPIGYVRKIYRSYYKACQNDNNRIFDLKEYIQIDYKAKERYFLKKGEIQYCLDTRQNLLVDSGCYKKKMLKKYSADSVLEVGEKLLRNTKTGETLTVPFLTTIKLE